VPRDNLPPPYLGCDSAIHYEEGNGAHLAFQLRFRETSNADNQQAEFDPLSLIMSPNCIYDKFQNRIPPSVEEDLRNYRSFYQTCPSDIDQP
jgi:hypothetical protein